MATRDELAKAAGERADELLAAVRQVCAAAVAAEREACARCAEEFEQVHPVFQGRGIPLNLREQIAAAIRARGQS